MESYLYLHVNREGSLRGRYMDFRKGPSIKSVTLEGEWFQEGMTVCDRSGSKEQVTIGVNFGGSRARAPPIIENRPCIYHFLSTSAPQYFGFSPTQYFLQVYASACDVALQKIIIHVKP